MSFLDGLLGPALTVGTGAAAAQQGAEKEARDTTTSNMLKQLQIMHQQEVDKQARDLHDAEIRNRATQYKQDAKGNWWMFRDGRAQPVTADQMATGGAEPQAPDMSPAPPQSPSGPSTPPPTQSPGTSGAVGSPAAAPPRATNAPSPMPQQISGQTKNKPVTTSITYLNIGGKKTPATYDKESGKTLVAGQEVKNPVAWSEPAGNIITTGLGADGKPMIVTGKNKGDVNLQVSDIGKPETGKGGGNSLDPESRALMIQQAKVDVATMKEIENKWLAQAKRTGKNPFGVAEGTLSDLGGLPRTSVGHVMTANAANTMLGAINDDAQRYATARESYGRLMGNLQSRRYTEMQREIERNVGGLGANDLENTVRYKQQLRDLSIGDEEGAAATPTAGGAGGRGATPPMGGAGNPFMNAPAKRRP